MARGTALSVLFTMLQARLGETVTGTQTTARYYQLLQDKQKWYASEYDWSFLETRWDVAATAGSRYLTFPTTDTQNNTVALNTERPFKVEVFWNNLWRQMTYGVGSTQYNYINSDQGRKQDPIQHWRWSGNNQVEIWPINVSPATLRFTGQRALSALVAAGDTADLDDELLVLSVAADLLLRQKQADAQLVMAQASERLRMIRASYPSNKDGLTFAKGDSDGQQKKLIPIAIAN